MIEINQEYQRVIPRDFFNEAKLLKCMGRLSLLILDRMVPQGIDIQIEESGEPFSISQTMDGDLIVTNYMTTINNEVVYFYTKLNRKDEYPFYVQDADEEEILVFDVAGNFTEEFRNKYTES